MDPEQTQGPLGQPGDDLLRARHLATLSAAVDAIVMIDTAGIVQVFNPAATRMFGYTAEEVIGRNVSMLMPAPLSAEHDSYLQRYLRTGEARIIGIGRELVALRKDGSTFPMELAVGEIVEHGVRGFVGLMRDITARKVMERELRERENELRTGSEQVQRLTVIGEMAAGIAHEINQPLTAIANYASAAQRLLENPDCDRALVGSTLRKLSQQAARAGDVIEGIRRLVRKHDPAREDVDAGELLLETRDLLEAELRRKHQNLELETEAGLGTVQVDRIQLQQVLLNLIRNAADAMTAAHMSGAIRVTAQRRSNDWTEIHIDDAGPGVAPDIRERIFEPFTTTKPEGFGLGLAICKSVVDAHGGELRMAPSPLLKGTRFSILLPVEPPVANDA